MRNLAFALCLLASPLAASDWTVAVGAGPFVFGDLANRRATISNGEQSVRLRSSISAATRAGVNAELERQFNSRFSMRLGATFARAPISIKTKSSNDNPRSDGITLEVGKLNVTTLTLPAVFRINRAGAFRPYLMGGPAYALYNMRESQSSAPPLFTGTRGRIGAVAGAGLEWWWRKNFAVRAELSDVYTRAPLRRSDFSGPAPTSLRLENLHNVHTLFSGIYRF